MIHSDLAFAATALTSIAEGADGDTLRDLVPLLGRGLVLAQREMLLHLLNTEPDWPWHQ